MSAQIPSRYKNLRIISVWDGFAFFILALILGSMIYFETISIVLLVAVVFGLVLHGMKYVPIAEYDGPDVSFVVGYYIVLLAFLFL